MEEKKTIYVLIDYKGQFGSKSDSKFYRSGMDINLLEKFFLKGGYNFEVLKFNEVDFRNIDWKNRQVIYTAQEDPEFYYKKYIDDVIYALELAGANVIPKYKFLLADNNKVFEELLRDITGADFIQNISSFHFGSFEDFKGSNLKIKQKMVFKQAAGAVSRGVFLAKNEKEGLKIAKKISKTPFHKDDLKDFIRPFIHKGYSVNSRNRRKFIVQNFISGLKNDWKILVFGDKFFIEYRGVRDNDFRASGSHKFLFDADIQNIIPNGIFEYAEKIRDLFATPHLSLDIGYIDNNFCLFEYQALYFSSYALRMSKTYFIKKEGKFVRMEGSFCLEELYVKSLIDFIESNCQ